MFFIYDLFRELKRITGTSALQKYYNLYQSKKKNNLDNKQKLNHLKVKSTKEDTKCQVKVKFQNNNLFSKKLHTIL